MDKSLERIVQAERRRNAAAKARIEARLDRARVEARRLALLLADADPGVRRVVLFGSVATGAVRNESFDIDLAVEGGDTIKQMLTVEESEFAVDIVDLDGVSKPFRDLVEKRGQVLYDSGESHA